MKKLKLVVRDALTNKISNFVYILISIDFIFISFLVALLGDKIWFDKNTIHYFFSAVFQGFSALLGILLIAMVFLIDKIDQTIKAFENNEKGLSQQRRKEIVMVRTIWGRERIIREYKKEKRTVISWVQLDLLSILIVIIVSLIALTQCSWYIKTDIFWNIFSVTFITLFSIFTILGVGKTIFNFIIKITEIL